MAVDSYIKSSNKTHYVTIRVVNLDEIYFGKQNK